APLKKPRKKIMTMSHPSPPILLQFIPSRRIQGIRSRKTRTSCHPNPAPNVPIIKAQISSTCAAGQENKEEAGLCAVKNKIQLKNKKFLKSLRITGIYEIFETLPVPETWDTWPVEDLLDDVFSAGFESAFDVLAFSLQNLQKSSCAAALSQEAASLDWE